MKPSPNTPWLRDPKKLVFLSFFVLVHIFILRNIYLLSRDMLTGDLSAAQTIPLPRYPFERIPDTPAARQYQAQGRLAVDFAQIYFPAQQMASLGQNYQTGVLDPLNRPSRYPPLLHFLCALTLCKMDYGPASLLHMALQALLFYLVFLFSFKALKIESYLLPALLLLDACLFLTPVGLSWLERGQFSLYVGAAYLLLLLGFLKKKPLLVLLAALFAFIKWTSFPTLAVFFPVYLLSSENSAEAKRALLLAAGFGLLLLGLTFSLPGPSLDFLRGLYQQERFSAPGGISLAKLLPLELVKFLPLPLVLLGWLHLRRFQNRFESLVPFLAGAALLMLTYPTLAYEYNLPSMLGFIPLFIYWISLPGTPLRPPLRHFLAGVFFAFVFLASFTRLATPTPLILGAYLLVSALLLLLPLFWHRASA